MDQFLTTRSKHYILHNVAGIDSTRHGCDSENEMKTIFPIFLRLAFHVCYLCILLVNAHDDPETSHHAITTSKKTLLKTCIYVSIWCV